MTTIANTIDNDPTVGYTLATPGAGSILSRIVYGTLELAREAQLEAAHQVGTVIPIRGTRLLPGDMFVE